jgi:copper chaperone
MDTKTYRVDGMTCGGCVASLTRALKAVLPDRKIEVTLRGGLVRIEGDHDPKQVERAADDAGYTYVGPV